MRVCIYLKEKKQKPYIVSGPCTQPTVQKASVSTVSLTVRLRVDVFFHVLVGRPEVCMVPNS